MPGLIKGKSHFKEQREDIAEEDGVVVVLSRLFKGDREVSLGQDGWF